DFTFSSFVIISESWPRVPSGVPGFKKIVMSIFSRMESAVSERTTVAAAVNRSTPQPAAKTPQDCRQPSIRQRQC
ncbi:MAG: hypothetical protein J6T96_08485, partial [Bacteroidales bacterium]|nr:hypothetical protein [Bacteroidales bacterium]